MLSLPIGQCHVCRKITEVRVVWDRTLGHYIGLCPEHEREWERRR